jgi:hypothetical protein
VTPLPFLEMKFYIENCHAWRYNLLKSKGAA